MNQFTRNNITSNIAMTLLASACISGAGAQEPNIADLQKNIDIFSGVLTEALDLEQAAGLFGISLGGIDSIYLQGQGVVLEVRTPLSSRRNTLSLASLTSTLQNMQSRSNPFATLAQNNAEAIASSRSLALSAGNEAEDFYRTMMERIANVDYSLRFNAAIQQASDYARSLRSLNGMDENAYQELRNDIDAMRKEMQEEFVRLREIETEIMHSAATATAEIEQADMQSSVDNVMARLEPLRDRAIAKAAELRERSRVAEAEYAARWHQEVETFETSLNAAMCNYGSTLHALPLEENVSVILIGLGEDTGENRRADKVHVFKKRDLVQCQNGDIDQQTLQERSAHYSY